MIDLSDVRVFLCTVPTKMNYSFDSLMGLAQQIFDQDPLSGHLFLFISRSTARKTSSRGTGCTSPAARNAIG